MNYIIFLNPVYFISFEIPLMCIVYQEIVFYNLYFLQKVCIIFMNGIHFSKVSFSSVRYVLLTKQRSCLSNNILLVNLNSRKKYTPSDSDNDIIFYSFFRNFSEGNPWRQLRGG